MFKSLNCVHTPHHTTHTHTHTHKHTQHTTHTHTHAHTHIHTHTHTQHTTRTGVRFLRFVTWRKLGTETKAGDSCLRWLVFVL